MEHNLNTFQPQTFFCYSFSGTVTDTLTVSVKYILIENFNYILYKLLRTVSYQVLVLARGRTISDHGFYQKDHKGPLILIYYFYLRNRYFYEVLTLYFQKKSILFKQIKSKCQWSLVVFLIKSMVTHGPTTSQH